jgi:hypothetical protein
MTPAKQIHWTLLATLLLTFCSLIGNAQEPPSQFEILKWYWVGFPKVHNGWKVEVRQVAYLYGDTEGVKSDIVNVTCDNCGYLKKYSFDVLLTYGYGDKVELSVTQNKNSTNKYLNLKYPGLIKKK